MDQEIGDEVADHVDGTHISRKENEFLINSSSSNMLQSNEMITPGVDERIGSSEHASASPRCMDGAGSMVEELTLKNYDGDKLTIVGTFNNRERLQTRQNPWQNLYQIASGSGIGNLRGQNVHKGKGLAASNAWDDSSTDLISGLIEKNLPLPNHNEDGLPSNDEKGTHGDVLGGIRTKILSKSGFSEYFLKSTLRDKGVIHKGPTSKASGSQREQHHPKPGVVGSIKSAAPLDLAAKNVSPPADGFREPQETINSRRSADGTLRQWLEVGGNEASKAEKLSIFKRVLDVVDFSHSHGISLQELRPSYFKLSGSHKVTYLGSYTRIGVAANATDPNLRQLNLNRNEKRPMHQSIIPMDNHAVKKQKFGKNMNFIRGWPQFPSRSGFRHTSVNFTKVDSSSPLSPDDGVDDEFNHVAEMKEQSKFFAGTPVPDSSQVSVSLTLEEKWYTSPELSYEKSYTFASNIYCLGVLLFELLGSFDSGRSRVAAMLDLHDRILPPNFLLQNPKEAGFCLLLLHPKPSSRPPTREILQSEFIRGIQESSGGESLISIDEEDGESELLLYFLLYLNEQKQKDASGLAEQIQRIEADIQEVEKRRPEKSTLPCSMPWHKENASSSAFSKTTPSSDTERRLMRNFKILENAYFSTRSNIQSSDSTLMTHRDVELFRSHDNWSNRRKEASRSVDNLGSFYDGFCKYARYSNLKVRGILRNGEFSSSTNVICSLSFDRDENYLATGGVSKKIKIYEFQSLFKDSVDIHYPVVEMSNRSKLTCICWNSYIRNHLASTDYDGIVKLWDAETGQEFSRFVGHNERAWSVDFSRIDPMRLASGSDDRLIKLWHINERNSLCTLRSNGNVCSVQFSSESAHLLAISSADHKTYCYDLRNVSAPWCVLAGHEKAVSYAKFLDAETLVSASTDSTLKIWDLKKTSSNSLSRDACVLTLRGHTNEKNFVGLSVADGYITCGSETNEVFTYYKSLPMPITAHKFGSIDPVTGKETEADNGQFISCVCWRQKSNMVIAANSSGCIKLLQMV